MFMRATRRIVVGKKALNTPPQKKKNPSGETSPICNVTFGAMVQLHMVTEMSSLVSQVFLSKA